MSEGVHAGPRGQRRREVARQFGVADRRARQEVGTRDDRLATGLGELNQSASPRLAPGPGRRGHRHHGRHRRLDSVLAPTSQVVVGKSARVRDQQTDCLGDIDWAASTEADESIASRVAVDRQAGQDVFLGRIGLDLPVDDHSFLERGDHLLHQPGGQETGIGHDQWPVESQPAQFGDQQTTGACPEQDPIREREDGGRDPERPIE